MLVAVLNTCTKEELEEADEDLAMVPPGDAAQETAERRKVIKNKIMAVGRMARVFALLRYARTFVYTGDMSLMRMIMIERNRRRSQSSRVFPDQPSCLMVLWPQDRKELRTLLTALRMRTSTTFSIYLPFT